MTPLIAFVILAIAVLILKPPWVLAIIIVSFFPAQVKIGGFDINTLLVFVACIRFAPQVIRMILSTRFLWFYGLFILWVLISLFWVENFALGIEVLRGFMRVFLIMVLVFVTVQNENDLIPVAWGCVVGIMYVFISLYLWEGGYFEVSQRVRDHQEFSGRIFLWNASPNQLALQVAWGWTITGYAVRKFNQRWVVNILLLVLMLFAWVVVVRLGSRAAMIALLGGGLFVFLNLTTRRLVFVFLLGTIFLGLMLVAGDPLTGLTVDLPLASEETNRRVQSTLLREGTGDANRFNIWRTGILISRDHLLFGVGAGNAAHYYPKYSWYVWRDPKFPHPRAMHNSFLTILVDLGLVGVLIYSSWLLLWVGRREQRNPAHINLFLTVCFLIIITGMTASFEINSMYMFSIALTYVLLHRNLQPQSAFVEKEVQRLHPFGRVMN